MPWCRGVRGWGFLGAVGSCHTTSCSHAFGCIQVCSLSSRICATQFCQCHSMRKYPALWLSWFCQQNPRCGYYAADRKLLLLAQLRSLERQFRSSCRQTPLLANFGPLLKVAPRWLWPCKGSGSGSSGTERCWISFNVPHRQDIWTGRPVYFFYTNCYSVYSKNKFISPSLK